MSLIDREQLLNYYGKFIIEDNWLLIVLMVASINLEMNNVDRTFCLTMKYLKIYIFLQG